MGKEEGAGGASSPALSPQLSPFTFPFFLRLPMLPHPLLHPSPARQEVDMWEVGQGVPSTDRNASGRSVANRRVANFPLPPCHSPYTLLTPVWASTLVDAGLETVGCV